MGPRPKVFIWWLDRKPQRLAYYRLPGAMDPLSATLFFPRNVSNALLLV